MSLLTPSQSKLFRRHLQDELIRRCRKNAGYSLRAFARTLEISASSLSRILRGERAISTEMLERLGRKLGLNPTEISRFTDSSMSEDADFRNLSTDAFLAISDWYHFAILELVSTQHFKPDSRWISSRLGITPSEATIAIERLQRLGLMKIDESGQAQLSSAGNTTIHNDLQHSAYRNHQKQILELALRALEEVPVQIRDQSSLTMSINSKRLPDAIESITRFRREFCTDFQTEEERDHVYQLAISFFPLTRP